MNNKFYYPISIIYIVAVLYLLITGSAVLMEPLNHSPYIPVGTILVWFGLVTLSYSVYRHFVKRSMNYPDLLPPIIGKYAGLFSLVMSLMWGFISYRMAGNWSFEFSSTNQFQIWLVYSRIVALLPIGVIIATLVSRVTRRTA